MPILKTISSILVSKYFWKNLALLTIAGLILLNIVSFWLKQYTHHGQQLKMPDYVGRDLKISQDHAQERSFVMVVSDSIFVVGKSGGIILRQTPKAGDIVKQDRKVYVTITKYEADKIKVSQLPILYGKNFKRKKKELKQGYELNAEVVGHRYDPGPADHILMAIYGRDTIVTAKGRKDQVELKAGSTIKFVLSKRRGGLLELPNLLCKTYGEARFLLESYQADIKILEDGGITDLENAFVWKQSPAVGSSKTIEMGSTVKLFLTQERPSFCPEYQEF